MHILAYKYQAGPFLPRNADLDTCLLPGLLLGPQMLAGFVSQMSQERVIPRQDQPTFRASRLLLLVDCNLVAGRFAFPFEIHVAQLALEGVVLFGVCLL